MHKLIKTLIAVAMATLVATPMVNAQKSFDRGIKQVSFIPKGQWVTGINASFTQTNMNNYQFFIVEDVSGNNYSMKISPMACYIYRDNMGVGGRFAYSRSRTKLDSANMILDSETDYSVDNLYSENQKFSTMAIFRNYIGLGETKRFGLFAEVQAEFGYGNSKISKGSDLDLTGTYKRDYSLDLGVSPGLVMFLNNYSAIEVNVGVLGFGYTHSKMITDQIYVANLKSQSATFHVNLFSISFGVAFYL